MRAETYPLRELLNMERRYVIPTFQRDYEWTKEGQWELFFEDLASAAERLAEAERIAAATDELLDLDQIAPHFLGAIVIDRMVVRAAGLDHRAVIDGQQRLTTIHLLARSLLDLGEERESTRVGSLRRMLRIPDDVVQAPEEEHKLWPRFRDRELWSEVMGEERPDDKHLYVEARRFFYDRARTLVEDDESGIEFEGLVEAFQALFRIVVIELDQNDDAQVIFEVLNGRQTPLSSADLVKNLLFLRAEQQNPGRIEALYREHWERFDDEWWKEQVGSGHATRRHADRMLTGWLGAVSESPAHPDRLYGQVRRYLDVTNARIPDVLAEIGRYASHYEEFRGRTDAASAAIRRSYEQIGLLAGDTALPLVLKIREELEASVAGLERAVGAVASYFVRRVALRQTTRSYNLTTRDVLLAIRGLPSTDVPHAVEEALIGLSGSRSWPSDEDIRWHFVNRPMYNVVGQRNIRLILGEIDRHVREASAATEPIAVEYDALTIEHLMPQQWRQNWPLDADDAESTAHAEQLRNENLHKVGNLTLISGPLNSSLSNAGWQARRAGIAEHSSLRLNASIVHDARWDEWDESRIQERSAELARFVCRVWPRPGEARDE